MTLELAEALLFATIAVNAALLAFMAGVLRGVMNDMDLAEFQRFVGSLYRRSARSPFMLVALNVPLIGAAPYFYFYGFGNRWLAASIAIWLATGVVAKWIKLPVYKAIVTLEASDTTSLQAARRKLNFGNQFQAVLYALATVIMMIGLHSRPWPG